MAQSTGGLDGTMNLASVVLALVAFASIIEAATIRENCAVSIDYSIGDLKEPHPLILTNGKHGLDYLHPTNKSRVMILKTGDEILLSCTGKGNYILGIPGVNQISEINANCVRGKTFVVAAASGQRFSLTSVGCKDLPKNEARRTKLRNCYGNDTNVEIGFQLKDQFLPTIEICRNDKTMVTAWTKFRLTTKIAGFQSGYPRPRMWKTGDFYKSYDMQYQYKATTQIKTVADLVGSMELAQKYIKANTKYYLARGHLTAKADFVHGSAQTATFWYLNAAPQWHTFNSGNWNSLEDNVRKFAAKRTSDLEVYTGTHGQMSLEDINGNMVPIYLYVNGNKTAFPVPKFYWKIIHDPVAKKATAFIGLNDPWMKKIDQDTFICKNIADKIKWLTWRAESIEKGVSYACTVDDLRKAVPAVPRLSVNGILA